MKMTDVSIDRPVFASMVAVAVLVMGILGFKRLGVDLFPDVSFPVVTITTPYPGAGPGEIESRVTKPIEDAVSTINGIDEVRSYSRDSASVVVAMFDIEADVRQAASDVRDRVAAIRGQLPEQTMDPVISRIDPTALPIVIYALASNDDPLAARQFADDVIRPALERVEGVGNVTVSGGAEREIRVELDRDSMEAVGLTVAQVAGAIRSEGFDLPGGQLTMGDREISLKAVGSFQTPAEIGEVVLGARPDGQQVRVKDVAKIVDGAKEARTRTRVNGKQGITLEVQKRGGTNTVEVVTGLDRAVKALKLPAGTTMSKVMDNSHFIKNNMHELERALVLGAIFAILVIFLFMLDWRSTLISAVALPTSVIATFFVMWLLGYTLNIMTMMGLSLAIGLLIDDSVVVRENIYRHMERGEDPVTAARKGTKEIALAVMATTFTIVAVFGPVAFTGGMIGKFFREFGITVSVAVLVSLVVSFTLDPMLSARVAKRFDPDHHQKLRKHRVLGPIARAYDALDAFYRSVLHWALGHRKTVIFSALGLFVGSMMLAPLMGQEFAGHNDQGVFTVNLEIAANRSLDETERVATGVEQLIRKNPEILDVVTTVGPEGEVHKARLQVKAVSKLKRKRSIDKIMDGLRPQIAAIPGVTATMREAAMGGASTMQEAPVLLVVKGPDFDKLTETAQRVFEIVERTPGTRDAAISYRPGRPEQRIQFDRVRAGDVGVGYPAVASTIRTAVEGDVVAKFREPGGGDDADIRVKLRPEDRTSLEHVMRLSVPTRTGQVVTLAEVTEKSEAATPATIERLDRERQIVVTANIGRDRSLGDVVKDVNARIQKAGLPDGYTVEFAGEAQRMAETFGNLGLALMLSVVFIYLVLASQFESLLHPFTIMLSLPLAIVGALATLFLTGYAMGMPAMIGIILLMGLVTKNAILLVDMANQLRAKGMAVVDALLEAGVSRLRPILMTSAAMILGMLPTALGKGEGSEFRAPMSWAVIGGVITSTLLTLVVIPVVYVWVDRFTARGRAERKAAKAAKLAGPADKTIVVEAEPA